MTGEHFIITGLQPWDISIGSNAKDMAFEIARKNKVLYVSTPLDYKTFFGKDKSYPNQYRRSVVKKQKEYLRRISQNLWVLDFPFCVLPINYLPDGPIFDYFNRWNNKRMYSFIQKIIKQLEFKDYIHFIDNDIYRSFYSKEYLQARCTVYYKRDNLTSIFWRRHAPRLEPIIASKANLVVTNSIQLAKTLEPYNAICKDIGQGVELTNFIFQKKYPVPEDIKTIHHPIIGYIGYLTSLRLDIPLIEQLAKTNSDCSIVLIGPEDDIFRKSQLHQIQNIHFLPSKEINDVPSYISVFDICMNPQAVNPITIGNYPRKIDEYLALGKPVVATATAAMELFENYVYNCTNLKEYNHAIKMALQENDIKRQKQRADFAHSHTWENCVEKLYQNISSALQL